MRKNSTSIITDNEEIKKAIKSKFDGQKQFKRDAIQYILSGNKLNEKQAERIYEKGWEDGHSSGYHNVMIEIKDLIDFIEDII